MMQKVVSVELSVLLRSQFWQRCMHVAAGSVLQFIKAKTRREAGGIFADHHL